MYSEKVIRINVGTTNRSRDSLIGSDGLRAGRQGFDSRQGQEIFLFSTASRPALGPTQPPTQWVAGALSLGVKRPGREADHSRMVELYLYSTMRLHVVVLNCLSTETALPIF
jgi:hypothetical protein